jgi:VIT1/CCC1 family predicted Fe2+/Mn2+ transporter
VGRIAPHAERHFTGSETVRDVVIGMSDGLTVPFALAAGLSGAVQNRRPPALAAFGWAKGAFTGLSPVRSAIQTPPVGGIAAVAYAIARLISGAAA